MEQNTTSDQKQPEGGIIADRLSIISLPCGTPPATTIVAASPNSAEIHRLAFDPSRYSGTRMGIAATNIERAMLFPTGV
jgi:hypothetical protein